MTHPFFHSLSVCIGAPKCGTTWLDEILRERYADRMPRSVKETFHFDRQHQRGSEQYHRYFAPTCTSPIEFAPSYLIDHAAADRIADCFNHQRLLVMVRDPYDRAASHLLHSVNRGEAWITRDGFELRDAESRRIECFSRYRQHVQAWADRDPTFMAVVRFPVTDPAAFTEVLNQFLMPVDPPVTTDWVSARCDRRIYQGTISRNRFLTRLSRSIGPYMPRRFKLMARTTSSLVSKPISPELRKQAKRFVRERYDFDDEVHWMLREVGEVGNVLTGQTT